MSKEETNTSIRLPGSGTGLDVSSLGRVFKHRHTTYKFLWLLAILEEFEDCLPQLTQPYHRIPRARLLLRMMRRADSYAKLYGLNLGKQDYLNTYIEKVSPGMPRIIDWQHVRLEDNLSQVTSMTENVCFRFLQPFLQIEHDHKTYPQLAKLHFGKGFQEKLSPPPLYYFNPRDIFIPWQWCEYLVCYNDLLLAWACLELEAHLKRHNRQVEGIFQMVIPEGWDARAQAGILWQRVLDAHPDQLTCPYMPPSAIRGDDHVLDQFIPQPAMLHDQPWNLVPTAPKTQAAKAGLLPNLDVSMSRFLDLQELAVWVLASHPSGLERVKNSYQRDIFSGMNLTNLPSVDGKPVIRERLTSIIERNHYQAKELGIKPWQKHPIN